MDKVETLTLFSPEKKSVVNYRSEYNVDMWRELKKRWMVFGVLISVALAVLNPRVGEPGGVLRMEMVRWAVLGAACYVGGRSTRVGTLKVRARLPALAALHAHAAAPACAAFSALALRDLRLDRRILEGAVVARSRGPCAWPALALRRDASALPPLLAATNYLASLLAAPLALNFFCGQSSVAPLSGVLWTAAATALPFLAGCWRARGVEAVGGRDSRELTGRILALILLYIDCCALLREAEGTLYVTDVLATLFLEVSSVALAVASSGLYARFGLLRAHEGRALALAAVPKAHAFGWEAGGGCMAAGLARLPSVFLLPAQALLLAALFPADAHDVQHSDDAQDFD